jgi:glutathionylspermidine synthase
MDRIPQTPRPDWAARIESIGLTYHSVGVPPEAPDDGLYWDESVAYRFTAAEIDRLEAAAEAVHELCLAAVDHACRDERVMERFRIPSAYRAYIRASWARRDPHLYGRFDFAYNPADPALSAPKLLEYNADTPTSLIETALAQWFWLQDVRPAADQFNSLHEALIARWAEIGPRLAPDGRLHLSAWAPSEEDTRTVEYLAETARQAGLDTRILPVERVGWRRSDARFVDDARQPIRAWFKLYPWEWLAGEPFGVHLPGDRMAVVEPVWKMLLSNKALLPLLWEMFPDHPNLLPAYWDAAPLDGDFVAKPILSREGANIVLVRDGVVQSKTDGSYRAAPRIYQRAVTLPIFDGYRAVLGLWMVGDRAVGLSVREDRREIVTGLSKYVPHFFDPG